MKFQWLFAALIFVACKGQLKSSHSVQTPITYFDSLKLHIIGQWGALRSMHPIWDIRKDSFYIFNKATAYSYKLSNDSMTIDLDSSRYLLYNLVISKDTLFFSDAPGTTTRIYRLN